MRTILTDLHIDIRFIGSAVRDAADDDDINDKSARCTRVDDRMHTAIGTCLCQITYYRNIAYKETHFGNTCG